MKDKVGIITGGGSGIGKATAFALADLGCKIVIADIIDDQANAVVREIQSRGAEAIYIKTDVSDQDAVISLVNATTAAFGSLDMMVNAAGIGGSFAFFEQIERKEWDRIIAINQTGLFFCMQEALKVMKAQRNGSIVNVSSLAGIGSAPRMGAYAASKHAVTGMTKTAAVEYGKYGIRINAVCPSIIKTPMGASYISTGDPVVEMVKQSIPMKRFGEADEVAQTIVWLCGDGASFVNGETVRIDGGHRA